MNLPVLVRPVLLATLLAASLAGCSNNEVPKLLKKNPTASVALPVAQLPPQPTSMAPQSAIPKQSVAADSGNANGPSQVNPRMLSPAQESATMPLPGQAGDHSTPAPISKN